MAYYIGEHSFEHIRDTQPNLALIGISFRDANTSWQLIEMLCQDSATQHIAITICSTDTSVPSIKAALFAQPGYSFLGKPFTYEAIEEAVAGLIGPPLQRE